MKKIIKQTIKKIGILGSLIVLGIIGVNIANAASTPTFNQTINPGTKSVDIVNESYVTVGSPAVSMGAVTFSFAAQTATGTLGTASEKIYVQNPDGADTGWSITIAPTAGIGASWTGAGASFDFNDPAGSGETYGQMTIDAIGVGVGATGVCSNCTMTGITLGASTAFNHGVTDSVTLLTGAEGSDDIGDWTLTGVSISQKIPKEKPAISYSLPMTITIAAI